MSNNLNSTPLGTIALPNETLATELGRRIQHELLQGLTEFPVKLSLSTVGLHISPRFELLRSVVRMEHAIENAIVPYGKQDWYSSIDMLKWTLWSGKHVEWLLSLS